ncbi:MAG: 50S ribosomal protein L11 methyltransferase [Bacteroidaceae bacterium]|nr:50S ribosomal protein L11 methyltransferase [Bacteroidaceae bacterium]MBR5829600.1 50S ribosomal protein L11 methyltransferase [Bacteroidaceae bacterium]
MNDYTKVKFAVTPNEEMATDVLAALLAEIGFESFVPEDEGMSAYVPQALYNEENIANVVAEFPIEGFEITYDCQFIEGEDWNAQWEKNYFQPIVLGEDCVIHSTFHTDVPKARYDILIDPKMAFGTGYHQTTCHMLRAILASDMSGKSVLDMGCGTALLAILARKHGAEKVVAIDIDEFAYENAKENVALNGTPDIEVRLGGADAIKESDSFDYVIANINRNILLMDMVNYVRCMHTGSQIFISGFYTEDMEVLKEEAARHGLRYLDYAENDNWAMMKFVKE